MKILKTLGWILLVLLNIFGVWSGLFLMGRGFFELSVTFFVLIFLIDYFIINPSGYPYRYMIPALILLFTLVLYPIAFTIRTAFTNYGTGHLMTRQEVVEKLLVDPNYTYIVDDGKTYDYSIYVRFDGANPTNDFRTIVKIDDEYYKSSEYKVLKSEAGILILAETELTPIENSNATFVRRNERIDLIQEGSNIYKYFYSPNDETTFVNEAFFRFSIYFPIMSKIEYIDTFGNRLALRQDDRGNWVIKPVRHLYKLGIAEVIEKGKSVVKTVLINTVTNRPLVEQDGTFYDFKENGEKIAVGGYISYVGTFNFRRIFQDATIAGPFAKIFAWNFTYAALSVLLTFSIGLILALVLNDPSLKGRAIYRSIYIIPWAIPAFISVLIWKTGFFNETYGIINRFLVSGLFGTEPLKWFNDPFLAKVAVLIVNTWLGFPYMMVISLGALQSIPEDYYEAASIDGATRWQRFWKITFPLLMTTLAPLLVGSFAFNFNNFVNIYLLTGGGPSIPGATTPAGATDILISYTYKLAFEAGRGQDFGFASAISILIFFIVAGISFVNFKLSSSFEEVNK